MAGPPTVSDDLEGSKPKRKRGKVLLFYSFPCDAGRGFEISTKNLSQAKKEEVVEFLIDNMADIFSLFEFCDLVTFFYKKAQVIVCLNNPFHIWCSIQKFGNYYYFHLCNATLVTKQRLKWHLTRNRYNQGRFCVSYS